MNQIKTAEEISKIRLACKLTDQTFDYILLKIQPGVTEKQISLEIQRFIRKNNATLAFRPIVGFGKNSCEIHHKPNDTKLRKWQIILLDFGARVNGYCSDMTRTVFMGKANEKQKKMYETVLEAQKKAIEFIQKCHSERSEESISIQEQKEILRPAKAETQDDIRTKDVDKIARDYIISQGYPSIPHSLGHGIGKKVHERTRLSPKSKEVLKPGMVFSVEPGIYIKNFGGVRIEDLVVLNKDGVEILTKSPKNLIELSN